MSCFTIVCGMSVTHPLPAVNGNAGHCLDRYVTVYNDGSAASGTAAGPSHLCLATEPHSVSRSPAFFFFLYITNTYSDVSFS